MKRLSVLLALVILTPASANDTAINAKDAKPEPEKKEPLVEIITQSLRKLDWKSLQDPATQPPQESHWNIALKKVESFGIHLNGRSRMDEERLKDVCFSNYNILDVFSVFEKIVAALEPQLGKGVRIANVPNYEDGCSISRMIHFWIIEDEIVTLSARSANNGEINLSRSFIHDFGKTMDVDDGEGAMWKNVFTILDLPIPKDIKQSKRRFSLKDIAPEQKEHRVECDAKMKATRFHQERPGMDHPTFILHDIPLKPYSFAPPYALVKKEASKPYQLYAGHPFHLITALPLKPEIEGASPFVWQWFDDKYLVGVSRVEKPTEQTLLFIYELQTGEVSQVETGLPASYDIAVLAALRYREPELHIHWTAEGGERKCQGFTLTWDWKQQ